VAASSLESGSTGLEAFFFFGWDALSVSLGDLVGDLPFSLGAASGGGGRGSGSGSGSGGVGGGGGGGVSGDASSSPPRMLLSTTVELLMGRRTGGVRPELVRMGTKGGGLATDLRGTSGRSVDLPLEDVLLSAGRAADELLDADVVTVGGSEEWNPPPPEGGALVGDKSPPLEDLLDAPLDGALDGPLDGPLDSPQEGGGHGMAGRAREVNDVYKDPTKSRGRVESSGERLCGCGYDWSAFRLKVGVAKRPLPPPPPPPLLPPCVRGLIGCEEAPPDEDDVGEQRPATFFASICGRPRLICGGRNG